MKKIYKRISIALLGVTTLFNAGAQCASTVNIGTATNMFTLIRNGNHPIVVNKDLNMVVFIHRTDAGLLGGNSGELRFDYSTNAGSTWTINQGVLNPANANYARYPNVAIYNPTLNTNPANVYVSYLAPTITSATAIWNGVVSGVRQVSGGVPTEIYNQNGIGTNQIPHSMIQSAPGIFWAIDPINTIATGFNIYRGVWSTVTNDVVWNINYSVNPPFATSWNSAPQVVDYNIAFDPTGQIGYFSFLGMVTAGTATNPAIYPILYKTTNGGSTWTGPIQPNLSGFSCITSNTTSGSYASTNVEHDLIVDVNGNPHIITTVGSAASNIFNYSAWHHMYDITMKSGVWTAYDLGNVNGAPYTSGISPNFATQWQAPQAARSANGNKIFFTWTDNANYSLGAQNTLPELYGKAFDVTTNMWTQTKNFTACNASLTGRMTFPHIAVEALEPSAGSWKLAGVFGEPAVTNDLGQTADFRFLDNLVFSSSEFTVAVQPATVTIAQGPSLIYCPNSTVNINVTGAGDVLWSTGAQTNPLPIITGSISTYSVIAQVGCLVGTASISVSNIQVSGASTSPSVCPGNPATFTASGNAFTYSWSPGTATGTNVILNPTSGSVTLTATGSNSCTVSSVIPVNILPQPTVSIAGNGTTCAGYILTATANGAQNYLWDDGSSGGTFTCIATTNTIIGVTGTAANTCTNTATISIVVNPSPNVNASSSSTAVCMGQTVALMGSGNAQTYSWNGTSSGPNMIATPAASTVYALTGTNSFSCQTTKTIAVTVYTLPVLTVTASRPTLCKGEKITLTASGAITYTWATLGVLTNTAVFTPSVAQTFTLIVNMMSTDGCAATGNYLITASACTGIDENSALNSLSFYPNPNAGTFVISGKNDLELELSNELGQVVQLISLGQENNHSVEIKDLSPGVYFIKTRDGAQMSSHKIIVSH